MTLPLLLLNLARAGTLDGLPSVSGPGEDQPPMQALPAGDLNGDGRGDLALGVPEDDGTLHEGGSLWVVTDAAALGPYTRVSELGKVLYGRAVQEAAGRSVAALGDSDGDGLDDLAIGAPESSSLEPAIGRVYLLSGAELSTASSLAELPQILGKEGWTRLGSRVYGPGDLDGDGLADLIVAAPYPSASGDLGVAWVGLILGETGGWSGSVTVNLETGSSPSTTADAAWTFSESGSMLGRAFTVLPDSSGDGVPELLIAAPGYGSHDHSPPPPDASGEASGHATGLVLLFEGPDPEGLSTRPVFDERDAAAAVEGHFMEDLAWEMQPWGSGAALAAPESSSIYLFDSFFGSTHSNTAPIILTGTPGNLSGWGLAAVEPGWFGDAALLLGEPGWQGGQGRVLVVHPDSSGTVDERSVLTLEGCLIDGQAGFSLRSHPGPDPYGEDSPWVVVNAPEASVHALGDGVAYLLSAGDLPLTEAACGEAPYTPSPDADGDGFTLEDGDCDDGAAWRFPGAQEVCSDGADDDCDGEADEECAPPAPEGCGRDAAILGLVLLLWPFRRRWVPLLLPTVAYAQSAQVEDQAFLALQGSASYEFLHGPLRAGTLGDKTVLAVGNYQGSTLSHSAGEVQLLWDLPEQGLVDLALAPVTLHGSSEHDYFGVSLDMGEAGLVVGADRSGLTERLAGVVTLWRDPTTLAGAVDREQGDLVISGDDKADALGRQVLRAGDLDGDGLEDWALGAPLRDSGAGERAGAVWLVHEAFGALEGPVTIDGAATGRIQGAEEETWLGWRVAAPGDMDGDGLDDLLVGELGGSPALAGSLWFYPGPLRGETPTSSDGWVSGSASDRLGFGLAVTDLDQDGEVEIALGMPGHGQGSGRVVLVSGVPEGQQPLQDDTIMSLDGAKGEGLGYALAAGPLLLASAPFGDRVLALDRSLGVQAELSAEGLIGGTLDWLMDLNADLVPDAAILTPQADAGRVDSGVAWVVSGAALLDNTLTPPAVIDQDGDGAPAAEDCDDGDPRRVPTQVEICKDGVDNDCDWDVDEPACASGGCSTSPSGGAWSLGLALLLVRRRASPALALLLAACGPPALDLSVPESPLSGEVVITTTGNFDQLTLLADGVLLGGGPGPGLSVTWDTQTVADGDHILTAQGYRGDRDAVEVSETVTIDQAGGDNLAPIVSFLEPLDGALLALEDQRVAVNISEAVGLSEVRLLLDGAELAQLPTAGPYELLWTPEALGSYTLGAEATDLNGNLGAASVDVEVVDGSALACSLTSPKDGATVSGVVTIKAAAASDAGVSTIEFYVDGELLATDGASPWSADWDSTGALGPVTLSLLAQDGVGAICEDEVTVTIGGSTEGITATITRPAEGATLFGSAAPVVVAAGGGAGISGVQLYLNSTLVGEDSAAPYEFTIDTTTQPNGDAQITAVATEKDSGDTATDTVNVTIENK